MIPLRHALQVASPAFNQNRWKATRYGVSGMRSFMLGARAGLPGYVRRILRDEFGRLHETRVCACWDAFLAAKDGAL